ncbi:MAG: hypothetical protein HKO58_02685 [Gammaproteobacteria bacterium]|nr:hypothetical protein [Gammaproteobacteria bacterium]
MKKLSQALFIALGTASLVCAPNIFATNGYFTHGSGTKNKGMAGAGIAMPEEAMAISNNPASALLVGDRFEAGASLFSPSRSYSSSTSQAQGNGGAFTIGPNNLDSAREYFVIPHLAYTNQLSDISAWGVAFYGRGGMNTKWEGGTATFDPDGQGTQFPVVTLPGTFGAGTAGVDLSQAFLDLSYARQLSENFTAGISAIAVAQVFEAKGVNNFAGFTESFVNNFFATGMPDPSVVKNLTNNGHDNSIGFGAKIGFHSSLSPTVTLAGSYQTEIGMSELDEYADLFAEKGGFDIPANAKFGLSFNPGNNVVWNLDIEHTWFSDVSSVGNSISNLFSCPTLNPSSMSPAGCLGGANGAGFGWDDMTVFKLGAQWGGSNGWTWRAGYSHGEQPISENEVTFNILAPAVIEDHITFGFTKETASNRELNFAFMYALNNSVKGNNNFDPTQTIELEMDQFELELSYTWKF